MRMTWTYNGNAYSAPVPAHICPFVRALGFDIAAKLFLELGGSDVTLSRKPRNETSSLLVRVIGIAGFEALNIEFGGHIEMQRRLPVARPFLCRHLYAQGETVSSVARRVRCSSVSVRKALSSPEHLVPGDG
jgi:hypothetical protein